MARGVEGNAAYVVVGDLEDAGVGLYRAARQADHQKGVGCFLEDHLGENPEVHLEVHLPGYLMQKQIQNTALILTQLSKSIKIFNSQSETANHFGERERERQTDPSVPSGC